MLGTRNPLSLLSAVFFYNGKKSCLRGGEEHCSLKILQLKWLEEAYVYRENGSKNHSGGLAQLRVETKLFRLMPHQKQTYVAM